MNENAMFIAEITQFSQPNGRSGLILTELPTAVKAYYDDMKENNCRIEVEAFNTDDVSVTISNDEKDIDVTITENGPQVIGGIVRMLERQKWNDHKMTTS